MSQQPKIAMLVDSGTDVPTEVIQQNPIYVIPLKIIYSETEEYIDKVTITQEEIYSRFPNEIPKTSLPDGDAIHQIFDQIKADGFDQVLAVTISSGLSGTYNMVRLMAEHREDLEIQVVDTKSIGIGAGLQAIRGMELINAGDSLAEVTARLTKEVANSRVYFSVDTLEYLQKGGRIGLVSSILGNALNLKPVISCNEDGVYYTVAKARGRKKSLEKNIAVVEKFAAGHQDIRLAVAHGDALAEGKELWERLQRDFPQVKKIYFDVISPALVVHTGPGLIGIGVQVLD